MTKNQKRTILVTVIVLIAFSVIAFALPFKMNGLFWLSYLFAVFSILVQLYVLKIAFQGTDSAKSKFYGFPIAQIGFIYMVVQLLLSILFMVMAAIAPIWIAVILYVLLLSIAAIGFISTDAVRDEIVNQDKKLEADVSCMITLRSLVYPLADLCSNDASKKILQDLADKFRYSDPVSNVSLTDIEAELELLVAELQIAAAEDSNEDIVSISKKVTATLTERNRLCKLNKKNKNL